ncbi:hypothetical protein CEXT_708871 [Caerostris extrusa]|uniref:Uncharacterized protein n=1 Tax=Caerostris extrusa TaxID=172846 RepID=A0AAV4VLM0_CAEEX|nr:hypothetical protein CEXT_708871 [Caerostris extrusa]
MKSSFRGPICFAASTNLLQVTSYIYPLLVCFAVYVKGRQQLSKMVCVIIHQNYNTALLYIMVVVSSFVEGLWLEWPVSNSVHVLSCRSENIEAPAPYRRSKVW